MKQTLFWLSAISVLLFSCDKTLEYNPKRNFQVIQKEILTQFIMSEDSSIIELPEGHFLFDKSLILEGKSNVTIKGQGIDKTILSFKGQTQGAEGLRIANCTNIRLLDFTIEDAAGDNIKATDTKGIHFERIKCGWTGLVDEQNGAYGFYPVLCENVVVRECEVFGASDAGIYVGQSDTVLIENNTVYWNVAGIESENSKFVKIRNNKAYENTGGILVFDLPGLTQYGLDIEVHDNEVYENNTQNFAPPGNMVGVTPPGTGILVLATQDVNIHHNTIKDNRTISIGILSYGLLEALGGEDNSGGGGSQEELENAHQSDVNYNPFVGNVTVTGNQYSNKYLWPDLNNDFGKVLVLKFAMNQPKVAWDGLYSPEFYLADGSINPKYRICVSEAADVTTAILDAGNDFEGMEINPAIFNCN